MLHKTYKIKFPLLQSALDYHEFSSMAKSMSAVLSDNITYYEIGYNDMSYWAIFYPKSMKMTEEIIALYQSEIC